MGSRATPGAARSAAARVGITIPCAIALALPAAARADGVGIVAASASGVERGAVADAFAQAIGGHVRTDAIGDARAALAAGAVPIEELARFRRVRDLIDEGWRAYLRVSVDFAQSRLAAARTDAEALAALPGGAELYADASLRLGIVLGQLGRTADAQAALQLALALDPERPITPAEFSPEVIAAVDAARAQPRQTREVAIASDPPGAMVAVDGADVGLAPLHAQLALGQHVIVARAPEMVPHAQAIAVDERTTEVHVVLDRDTATARLAEGARVGLADAATQELADATLRFADLDELVLVAASDRRGGEALLVQRCAGLPVKCSAVVELGYGDRAGLAAAARAAWQAVHAAELRYPPSVLGDPRVAGERVVRRCEWCRSPWLWSGVGAAAVVGTIAVIAIVSASKPPPIVSVDPSQYVKP